MSTTKLLSLESFKVNKNKLDIFEILFCFITFLFMFFWAVNQKYNYAPDEYMRYLIPKYIYNHGSLPLGWDPEVVVNIFGASYAYYPCQLGAIISALFMKIVSFFTHNEFAIVVAGRMTSVFAGTFTAYFTIKISKSIFNDRAVKWIMIVLVSWIPQFLFLSSYINNDVLGVLSSSVIICAWVYGLKYGWNLKNCLLLALGIIICALSYQTAFGWILLSVILFVSSYVFQDKKDRDFKLMLKWAAFISVIVFLGTAYLFIRNAVLYNGDLIGSRTFLEKCELYGMDFIKPSNRETYYVLGKTIFEMLSQGWIGLTYKSFIGVFGYMNVFVSKKIYIIYAVIFVIGLTGLICTLITGKFKEKDKRWLVFDICMLMGIFIPIVLSIYYSYVIDYQPQGRYCYPLIIGLVYFITKGYDFFISKIKNKTVQYLVVILFCLVIIALSVTVYLSPFLTTANL